MKSTIALLLGLGLTPTGFGDDGSRLLRLDHYVQVHSTVPAIAGQEVPIADGRLGMRVVDLLERSQRALDAGLVRVTALRAPEPGLRAVG